MQVIAVVAALVIVALCVTSLVLQLRQRATPDVSYQLAALRSEIERVDAEARSRENALRSRIARSTRQEPSGLFDERQENGESVLAMRERLRR